MSSDVTLLLHTDRHAVAAVFRQLFARLQPRLSNYRGEHAIKRLDHAQEIVATALPAQLPALMTDIVDSNRWVSISMDYTLASGALLDLSIHCNGQHYEHEWWVRLYGYLWIGFEVKYIVPPQEGGVQRPPVATHPAFPGQRFTDTEELFFRIVGLTTTSPSVSLVHHAWQAFAHDFTHIYGQYHWGMGALYLHPEIDVWSLSDTERDELRVLSSPPRSSAYHDADPTHHDHLAFLDWLEPPMVQRLAGLSPSAIRDHIHAAVAAVPEVRGYDFGERGYVLAIDPPQTVWRVQYGRHHRCISGLVQPDAEHDQNRSGFRHRKYKRACYREHHR
jgi:hypothetical protein